MKSKKFIAPAMLCMCIATAVGSIVSQSEAAGNMNTAKTSHILALIDEWEMIKNGELDLEEELEDDVLDCGLTETEVAEIEATNVLMGYQTLSEASGVEEEESTEVEADEEVVEETTTAYVIACSDEEYWLLVRLVEAEAGNYDVMGRILVADVVINRVRSSAFPNSIYEVIYSYQQFQPITTGYIWEVAITDAAIEAVNRALSGEDYSQGATYFSSTWSAAAGNWQSRVLTRLFEYGGNVFYTE